MPKSDDMPELSVVIVTYNSANEIDACLKSIFKSVGVSIEVIVVDNASSDSTCSIVSGYSTVCLVSNRLNYGFPKANNIGISYSTGDLFLLLNPDTIVGTDSILKLVQFLRTHPKCGIVGPQLVDGNGIPVPDLPVIGPNILFSRFINVSTQREELKCVSGAALCFSREFLSKVGLLDEELFWCEDYDYCRRAHLNGYTVNMVRNSIIVHLGQRSGNSNKELMIEKSYTSKIGYLSKYHSASYVNLSIFVFLGELFLRMVKWSSFWFRTEHREESIERLRIYSNVSRVLVSRLYL